MLQNENLTTRNRVEFIGLGQPLAATGGERDASAEIGRVEQRT